MNPKIRAAIFDLDGTTAYTAPDLLYSMNLMLEHFGFSTLTMEQLFGHISFGERDFVKYSLPEECRNDEALIDKTQEYYVGIYEKHFLDRTCLYDGLEDVIRSMQKAGIRLAVNTNKAHAHALAILNKIIPDTFEEVLGYGIKATKPDPSAALYIAEQFGVSPAETLYIGDSDIDMHTATNAGMTAVGVTWGYRPEDILRENGAQVIVHKPEELLALCGLNEA
ncbi:MAG: HAD family hydrolase [Ruminococcaceae bacterium]|nr:HAD family hydrolase [Oscillospiraceae bacterium]